MCQCTPNIRTPWCGRGNCNPPKPEGTRVDTPAPPPKVSESYEASIIRRLWEAQTIGYDDSARRLMAEAAQQLEALRGEVEALKRLKAGFEEGERSIYDALVAGLREEVEKQKSGWNEAFRLAVFHQDRANKAEANLAALRRSHAEVVAGLRKEHSACIQLASRLANRDGLQQLFPDGHPKPATRGYWLRLLGVADDNSAAKAMDLRCIVDRLSTLLTTLSPEEPRG